MNKEFFKFSIQTLFFILLTIWGTTYFIHSSELWSVSISKHLLNPEWRSSLELKPLFYMFLNIFHHFELTDWQHIQIVRFIFAVAGAAQVLFFYLILQRINNLYSENSKAHFLTHYLPVVMIVLLLTSEFYLTQFFRIRTDQISTLILLYLTYKQMDLKSQSTRLTILGCTLLLLLSAKSLLFIILIASFRFDSIQQNFKKLKKPQRHLLILAAVATAIWAINLNWHSVEYMLAGISNFKNNFLGLLFFIEKDFVLITLIFIFIFYAIFKSAEDRLFFNEIFLTLLFIWIVPQKYPHFIASLIPVMYLFIYPYILKLSKSQKALTITILIAIFANHLFYFTQNFPYRSNSDQGHFITSVSNYINTNKLVYLDGFSMFPRQKGMNCLNSPDDPLSKKGCQDIFNSKSADLIILTPRLMPIAKDDKNIIEKGYHPMGANLFLRNDLSILDIDFKHIPPALMVFAFEY